MDNLLHEAFEGWPKPFIRSYALQELIHKEGQAYHSVVKRAMQKGLLVSVQKGLYQIDKRTIDLFELAQELYGPSFISFESALSYHGWIPEAVYTTTSACMKRGREIETPFGLFAYLPVPVDHFYLGVGRVEESATFLMASPWRAIADLIHAQKRDWKSLKALCDDMRIELDDIWVTDVRTLEELTVQYPNRRVRGVLNRFLKNLQG